MDELVNTSDPGFNRSNENDRLQMKVGGEECPKDSVSGTKVTDHRLVPLTSNATLKAVDQETLLNAEGCHKQIPSSVADTIWPGTQYPVVPVTTPKPVAEDVLLSREECPEEVPSSDTFWPTTQYSQSGCKIATQVPVSVESLQPQWSETSCPPPWCEQTQSATVAATDPVSSHSQAGTKRKLQSFISNNESTKPSKIRRRAVSREPSSPKQELPEVQIVESNLLRRMSRKVSGTASSNNNKSHQKGKPRDNEFSPKMQSRHTTIKQSKQASTTPLPSLPVHYTKKGFLSKTSTPKPVARGVQVPKDPLKVCRGLSDSSKMSFLPVSQDENQITDDSADCYIDEMFSTPPPSPTFEMWLGDTVKTSGNTAMKTVLLETLFQLLGVITQPKTEQQEAVFVDLLEKTLRVMKTEIAK